MNTFKPGDIAIIINPKSRYYLEECVIESELRTGNIRDGQTFELIYGACYYLVSVNGTAAHWSGCGAIGIQPQHLRPKPPKATDLTTWTEVSKVCGWQPRVSA